ncbi:MAG: alpha/beta hydrolase domain-containing protein [Bryobacteraceae bacterium]
MLIRAVCAALVLSLSASAAIKKVHIVERTDVLNGRTFGKSGAYERIIAKAHFTVDPALPANRRIRDIGLAPKNAAGLVEFTADLYVLKPRLPEKGNGTILYEVSNRGGKGLLSTFNYASGSKDPRTEAEFGDAFLLEQGYTLVWVGWQFDIPEDKGNVGVDVPRVDGINGIVRSEFVPSEKTTRFSLADRTMKPYAVSDPDAPGTQLLVRDTSDGPRRVIPRSQWKFWDNTGVEMAAGFLPGKFYEVIYTAANPAVVGLGLAATRDIVSFLKYTTDGGTPLGDQSQYLKRAIAFGTSQSGRFLRTFLYFGFNADENGKKVFDGVWPHVAGAGRGSFNHRFAQPSRDGHRMTNTFYPTDIFPFADLRMMDPDTREVDGLLSQSTGLNVQPRIFYTNGAYEYWGRAASLIHTTPDGRKDDGPADDTRIYFLSGTQHGPGSFPPKKNSTAYLANPNDARPIMRALLTHMTAWVNEDKAPPPSRIPRVDKGELAPPGSVHFPAIPGVSLPKMPHQAWRVDYGPDFKTKGIVTIDPPKTGKPFVTLVPQVDRDGNEISGVRMPDVSVPLGTYTGWNLRDASIGAPAEIYSMTGGFHAFPATMQARTARKDPRPAISERYASKDDYMGKIGAAIDALATDGFLLPADRGRLEKQAELRWAQLTSQ